jgi:alanine dehydrogenase
VPKTSIYALNNVTLLFFTLDIANKGDTHALLEDKGLSRLKHLLGQDYMP